MSKKLNNLERFYAKNERRLTNTTEAARATSTTQVHFIQNSKVTTKMCSEMKYFKHFISWTLQLEATTERFYKMAFFLCVVKNPKSTCRRVNTLVMLQAGSL